MSEKNDGGPAFPHCSRCGENANQRVAPLLAAIDLRDYFAAKAQGIEMVCRETVKDLPAIDAEIKRLQALKVHRVAVSDGLKAYLKRSMEAMGMEKIQCPVPSAHCSLFPFAKTRPVWRCLRKAWFQMNTWLPSTAQAKPRSRKQLLLA